MEGGASFYTRHRGTADWRLLSRGKSASPSLFYPFEKTSEGGGIELGGRWTESGSAVHMATQRAAMANAVRCISHRSALHFLGHYCAACSPSLFSGQQHVLTCTKSLAAKALSPRLKKPQAGVQYRFTRHGVKQANRFLHSTIRLSLQTKRNCAKETVTASALAQPYP